MNEMRLSRDGSRAISSPVDGRIEIRAASAAPTVEDSGARPRLAGHFARFNTFNEIDSAVEGRFLERIEPGAFKKTLSEGASRIRMLFQHGRDPEIGDKPIGHPEVLREDRVGPYFEGDLFDSVPALIVDGLRAGQYGISYRFQVVREDWNPKPKRSDVNPMSLPERTIREARVFEFGPVTFPADPGADYAVRSITLSDLDAAFAPHEEPALPRDGAEPVAHSDEGSREAINPVSIPKEKRSVFDISQYRTREEMASRMTELDSAVGTLASAYPGVLPTEEQVRWDDMTQEQDALRAAAAAWDVRQARVAGLASREENRVSGFSAPMIIRKTEDIYDPETILRARSPEERNQILRDDAMRSVDQAVFPHPLVDQAAAKAHVTYLLDNKDTDDKDLARRIRFTGSPIYKRAFNKQLAGKQLTVEESRAAALAVGVDATGGFLVPYVLDPTIIALGAASSNPYRSVCRIETITGTDTWRGITATAIVAAYRAEGAATVEQGPTFAGPEFIAKRADAFVTASYEVMQDRPDLASELAVLFQDAKDVLEEAQFTKGVGTTVYPQGMFLDGAFTAVPTITNDVTAVADLDALVAALPLRHRMRAVWFLNRAAIGTIQGWETTGGRLFGGTNYASAGTVAYNWAGATGLRLLGFPVYEVPSADALFTTDAKIVAVLADPSQYLILDRLGMGIEVIPNMFDAASGFPTGQRGIFAFWRNTARVLNANGGRQLKVQ